jgi:hypothetical protein
MFKNFVKQNNDSNKTCIGYMSMISYCAKLCLSDYKGLWIVVIKQNNFLLSTALNVRIFRFSQKM